MRLLALAFAATAAAQFSFNKSMYHNDVFGTAGGDPWKAREIVFFDGALDVTKGGSVSLTSGNGTFDDTKAQFTEQFKMSLQTAEWMANVTTKVGAATVNGRAIFFQEGGASQCLEVEIFSAQGSMAGFLQRGPNPAPRPPSPGPGPRPPSPAPTTCYNQYAQSGCDAASSCKWCSSSDSVHHLCFATTSALDKGKWSCSKSTTGAATPLAVAATRAANAKCTGQAYPGVTYDVTLAAKTSAATDRDACCSACFADKGCDHWSFNPSADAASPCHTYAKATHVTAGYLYHATPDTYSGSAAATPPGPFPPSPTPAPAPTPPPSPPPAPSAPTPSPAGAQNWAVIVAGSQGFGNYRHHADACHAYQIVLKNGIPKERVILMMQDNVANAPQNPFPGQLFNKPTAAGVEGVDVYEGCAPDYTGFQVNKQLFLDVLTGNTTGNATKVLKSGPKDKVFVNFADHGGGQLIAMPNGEFLKAQELNAALQTMHDQKMYEKLVFYMEACNSGSMFEGLLDKGLNIYATTAANPSEPSWGTYCPPQDSVNGKSVGSCLGDLYSVNWMEDSDTKAGLAERLGDQFIKVKAETNKSHCMEYGDQSFKWSDHASDYQGALSAGQLEAAEAAAAAETAAPQAPKDAVDSRDIDLVVAFYAYLRATCPMKKSAAAKELAALVEEREAADARYAALFAALPEGGALRAGADVADCEHRIVDTAERHCGAFTSYSLKFTKPLVDACRAHSHDEIHAQMLKVCL